MGVHGLRGGGGGMKDTFRARIQEEPPLRKHADTSSLAPQRRLVVCQKSFILLLHQTGTLSLSLALARYSATAELRAVFST